MSGSNLSTSGSSKPSSLSSLALAAPGTGRPGVDVLTMGTDWEACSVESDGATSENTDTGDKIKDKTKSVKSRLQTFSGQCQQKYLVLPLGEVWWGRCVRRTPLHELLGTRGFHTSQDLKALTRQTLKKGSLC